MTSPLDSRDKHLLRHPEDPRVWDNGEGHSDGDTEEHQAAQLEVDTMLVCKFVSYGPDVKLLRRECVPVQ